MRDGLRLPAGAGSTVVKAVVLGFGAVAARLAWSAPAAADDLVPPIEVPPVVTIEVPPPPPPVPEIVEPVAVVDEVEQAVEAPVPAGVVNVLAGEKRPAASEEGAGPVVEGMDSEATGPADDMPVPLDLVIARPLLLPLPGDDDQRPFRGQVRIVGGGGYRLALVWAKA